MVEDTRHAYVRIYAVVRQIPYGKVATYGQIAELVGGVTARMVGYAMSALPDGTDVPWQRVINFKGKISPHGMGLGSLMQREMLVSEGVEFDPEDRIDFNRFGWLGKPWSAPQEAE
jgi:methylated-DNA-protein-cysteine methyltransferase-like protein